METVGVVVVVVMNRKAGQTVLVRNSTEAQVWKKEKDRQWPKPPNGSEAAGKGDKQ